MQRPNNYCKPYSPNSLHWLGIVEFAARSDRLHSLRDPEYPLQDDPSVLPIHVSHMEWKKRFTRAYADCHFVLTPAGFLHKFSTANRNGPGGSVSSFTLFLPSCTLSRHVRVGMDLFCEIFFPPKLSDGWLESPLAFSLSVTWLSCTHIPFLQVQGFVRFTAPDRESGLELAFEPDWTGLQQHYFGMLQILFQSLLLFLPRPNGPWLAPGGAGRESRVIGCAGPS